MQQVISISKTNNREKLDIVLTFKMLNKAYEQENNIYLVFQHPRLFSIINWDNVVTLLNQVVNQKCLNQY